MSSNRDKAERIASRSYTLMMVQDLTTDEDDYVYVAMNPEIQGCKAQGLTMEEAQKNLDEVRVDLIEHLLDHGLYVPPPSWEETSTQGQSAEMVSNDDDEQPNGQDVLFTISLKQQQQLAYA